MSPGGTIDPDIAIPATGQKSADHLVIGDASALPLDDPAASTPVTGSVPATTSAATDLDDLKSGEEFSCPISVRCLLPGSRMLRVHFAYQTDLSNPDVPDFLICVPGCTASTNVAGQSRIIAIDTSRVSTTRDRLIRSHCVKSLQMDLDVREPFGLTCQTLSLEVRLSGRLP